MANASGCAADLFSVKFYPVHLPDLGFGISRQSAQMACARALARAIMVIYHGDQIRSAPFKSSGSLRLGLFLYVLCLTKRYGCYCSVWCHHSQVLAQHTRHAYDKPNGIISWTIPLIAAGRLFSQR
jgi:hypothetical protein